MEKLSHKIAMKKFKKYRRAFLVYGRHKESCPRNWDDKAECECGFLEEVKNVRK